jgi:hypothetical protein
MRRRPLYRLVLAFLCTIGAAALTRGGMSAAESVPTPEQFIGFRVGTDNKLARWDRIVDYMQAAGASDRVRVRELGKSTRGNPFLVVEISSAETIKQLDRFKQLEQQLYFQNGAPSTTERDEIFRSGKVVVLVTCGVHANEVGATQMAIELTHRLATDDSPQIRKILDNVIVLLVPSANPDGQIMIADWVAQNVGTPYEGSPLPYLYHPYVGHDINRDMFMLTQKESQHLAQLAWHDWFPSIWLDQHQMDSQGPRIFVMPAADPINPNVHPLIYRWNGILGQSQAAALEASGREGIIYNSTYTNFWQGALAWTGWWHNQIGLLTEVASARFAAPVDQALAARRGPRPFGTLPESVSPSSVDSPPLPPPTDVVPRTQYPRPWLGGRWTLRDIVDYELIATVGLLETAADRREALLRNVYEINRATVEDAGPGEVTAILIPRAVQHDPREADHLVERLQMAGVAVYSTEAPIEIERQRYDTGTYVVPMSQVFARYAKDLLEKQIYPDLGRSPGGAPEAPYDVTAWSLGMLLGVDATSVTTPLTDIRMARLRDAPRPAGRVSGTGERFVFTYAGADTAIAINRLLALGAQVTVDSGSRIEVRGASRSSMETLARDLGLNVSAMSGSRSPDASETQVTLRRPRIGLYSPWTGGSMDEGWTRWILEQYEFTVTTIRNDDIRQTPLRQRFDVVIMPEQNPRDTLVGYSSASIRPLYRGGIGDAGVENLARFIKDGGTLVALGNASDLAIDRLGLPLRNEKRSFKRDQHYGPGAILHIETNPSSFISQGVRARSYGFYTDGPFFAPTEGLAPGDVTVVARYPASDVLASGWLLGESQMAGYAAVVSVDLRPGRVVLFGIRPQHRAQTHATFPLLFNSLYLSAADGPGANPQAARSAD